METLYYIILVPMVYVAFGVFLVGTVVRLTKIFRQPRNPTPLQIYPEKRPKWLMTLYDTFLLPSVLRHKPVLWIFLMVFHLCFLLVIIGHIELFGEMGIFQVIEHEVFLGKGFVGLILCLCVLFFLIRRLVSPYKDLSVPEDYYLLILLFLTFLFGSQMDWARRWYQYGGLMVVDYREYLMSLLRLSPELPVNISFSGHSFMLVLHVFFANLFLLFFPFSQLMHSFLSLPINKLRRG